jgi:hypothetical protein
MKTISLIFLLVLMTGSFAAFNDLDCEAHSGGLGGIITFTTDADALFGNPAGLYNADEYAKHLIATTHYSNFWGLSALSDIGVAAGYRQKFGAAGLSFRRFGTDFYSENLISLNYANAVYKKLSAGIRLSFGSVNMGDYGTISTSMIDVGAHYKISDRLKAGFIWQNLTSAKLEEVDDIASPMSLGLEMSPIEWAKLYLDVQRYKGDNFRLQIGQKIDLSDDFALKLGVTGKPNKLFFGMEAHKFDFTLSYSGAYSSDLGLTNHFVLKYE